MPTRPASRRPERTWTSSPARSLVLWGDRDIYLPAKFGPAYADVLPNAIFELIEGAGHWPWIDDPSVIDRVVGFVDR